MAGQVELHNKLAGEIVDTIVRPILESGGTYSDVLVHTETVVVGVALICVKFGGDEKMIELMFKNVSQRLAEIRLRDIKVAGTG